LPDRLLPLSIHAVLRIRARRPDASSVAYLSGSHIMPAGALPMPFLPPFQARPFLLSLALALGCGGTPTAGTPAIPQRPPPEPSELALDTWESVVVSDMPLEIPLPGGARWRQSRSGSFAVLEDARTRSKLVVRVWRAARRVQPAECEAEARLARPDLVVVEPSALIEERAISAPQGFHGMLRVAAAPAEVGRVKGVVVAVGAAVGRCYFAGLETSSEGEHAAETVADRLLVMVSATFETLRIIEVEERVLTTPRG
jgi:hypothetical protein